MNAVIVAVLAMLILSLLRVNVVVALIIGAIAGGLAGGLGFEETISVFSGGLGGSASIALSYALLGAFAVAISKTGLPDLLVNLALKVVSAKQDSKRKALSKTLILLIILTISIFSQNVIPVHIAFIPILIPPLLKVFNELKIDRRLIASVITFGLTAPYILLPVGFGAIFQDIIKTNMAESGLILQGESIPLAMLIPTAGLVVGLLIAIFFSYRKDRNYETIDLVEENNEGNDFPKKGIGFAVLSVVAALVAQLQTDSMIIGALFGLAVIYLSGSINWKEADDLTTIGMKMMAFIGFVMIAASGFAAVVRETGDVGRLVDNVADMIAGNQAVAAIVMLLVGLLITMGIGTSFGTIPIIASIYVPLGVAVGFSPMAIIALIGTAAALGDAGSPASDSTLGPTSGLNADGQQNHIWDTCVPTFIHYNIPLIIFGWIAAMVL
ncbi:sodium:proton antiporter [Lottiidibacillus patelloidae]|uniref:Sodium:proton antiporter n=1 Tax=Lottiidibacillus patelloidae TaxID=2670334 RepID=A0A263BPR9_9BACI|nr:Na+/H+ antiporter family protein [Lottiidibacillus patelloidae]OZM55755.1 sodium:proton antiporter [Lottiidibacillus patelloidae]